MFYNQQPQDRKDYYAKLLNVIGSLSNLFSDSREPYLAPRITENLFCKAFDAYNHSRSDASADASKDGMGFGIKTFLDGNGRSMQKIAEFNSDHLTFNMLAPKEKVEKIAELRNERLTSTKGIFGLHDLIYHCITRKPGQILVYEAPVSFIEIEKIKDVISRGNTIQFSDPSGEYSFNSSKSTLSKRFITENVVLSIPVKIIRDPFEEIEKIMREEGLIFADERPMPHVFLPLYSDRGEVKNVQEKSALNQWNARPRLNSRTGVSTARNLNEAYIPVPSWIHKKFQNFFPARDAIFELRLPNGKIISASICQDGSKALMSNPNADLGEWILRDVLRLNPGELLTYEKLEGIGLDSVVVYKIDNGHYDINFTRIGSYEKFKIENTEADFDEDEEAEILD